MNSYYPEEKRTPRVYHIGYFIVALILLFGLMLLMADVNGVRYGLLEATFWIASALLAGGLFTLSFALAIAPQDSFDSWMHMVELTIRTYLLPRDVETAPQEEDDFLPGLPPDFTILRAGFVRRHYALALARGNRFSRAAGPGFVYLFRRETVQNVIDLRRQQRRYPFSATTRDGIPLESAVSITYQIRQRSDAPAGAVFPYDPTAVFQMTYNEKRDAALEIISQEDQIAASAINHLVYQIARYPLDALLQTNREDHTARVIIRHKLQRHLRRQFADQGINIIRAGMGGIELPEKVRKQREDAWLASWERKTQSRQSVGSTIALRQVKQARARAQIRVIENIVHNIEQMRMESDENIELKKIVLLRMMEALEEAAADQAVNALLPKQIITGLVDEAMTQIQGWLAPDEAPKVSES